MTQKFHFSKHSLQKRDTLHPDLQCLADEIIKYYDCSIICGHRNKEDQNRAFEEGHSKVKWPSSKHNSYPSQAVDLIMYPIDWADNIRNVYFGGFVMGVAVQLKENGKMHHSIIWGGNWNNNDNFHDQNLFDYPHFQLVI